MTSQIPDQIPLPGSPVTDGARHCKQPGCGTELPAATGRGAPRLFCSPACSRKWHNDSRLAPGAAGQQQAAAAAGRGVVLLPGSTGGEAVVVVPLA